MLEDVTNSTENLGSENSPETTPASPPRRRRAASRPAGPPKVVEAPADVPVTMPAGQAGTSAASDSTSTAGQDTATGQTGAVAPTTSAAGSVPTGPVEVPAEHAPPKRTRRATRKAAPPAPVTEIPAVPVTTAAAAATPAAADQTPAAPEVEPSTPAAQPAQTEQSAPTAEPAPTRTRRTRARKSAVAAPDAEATSEAPAAPAVEPTQPTPEADQPASEANPQTSPSGVDAALAAATAAAADRPRRGRRVAKSVANPFLPAVPVDENGEIDKAAALQSLAASIAAPAFDTGRTSKPARKTTAKKASSTDEPATDQPATDEEPISELDSEALGAAAVADQLPIDQAADDDRVDDVVPGALAKGEPDEDDENDPEENEDDSDDSAEEDDSSDEESAEGTDDESAEGTDDDSDDSDDSDEGGSRRRRRRRGGRRRRRGSDADDSDDTRSPDDADDADSEAESSGSSDQGEDAEGEEGDSDDAGANGRRRRRRRRRRGEDTAGAEDDPSEVVVRVREPRRSANTRSASDEVTGIEGSTRMEARKQRRREGRAAGRRRAPILSEAEFLARRESVERTMVIRQLEEYTQLAVLEDGILVEHYVDRASSSSLIGNIYLGRVQNVLPSMEAAFIDIGRGRNAVLYAGEIDWDGYGAAGQGRKVEQVLKSGQTVLVQVSKDPVGAKGARLTSHISLPGRYVVYSPGGHLSGISRKLADTERHRLKDILGDLIDDKASVIVRTAAEGASEEELVRDVNRLKAQWEVIDKKTKQGSAPQQLYAEPDLTVRIVRDLFTEDFSELVVAGNGGPDDAYESINAYVTHVAPHLAERLTRWDDEQGDPFAPHKIDDQIAKALERKVYLPSGGSLVIDRTEAMTVIDVNTGKFTGTGGNLEATVTSNNLEAAEEIVRQLRLRDIGGIIVVDFIDMVLPNNRDLLLRRLVECLGRDRTRHQVAEVTSLGLVQMTRKKIGTGLAEAFTEECETCAGRGYTRHDHPVETQAPADGGDRSNGRRRGGRGSH